MRLERVDHNKLFVCRPQKHPFPTFFPVFTNIERYNSAHVNNFVAKQLNLLKRTRDTLKTVVNTSAYDAVVVPRTYEGRDALIIDPKTKNLFEAAWKSAIKLAKLARKIHAQENEYKQIKQDYKEQYGTQFKPDCLSTLAHHYPILTFNGWLIAKTIAGYVQHFPTKIKIVPPDYRRHAEIGIDFFDKHKCYLCVLSSKRIDEEPYHLFFEKHHTGCPLITQH